MDQTVISNYFECNVTLTIQSAMKALRCRAGNNVIHRLRLRHCFVGDIADISTAYFFIVAAGWQMDHNLHHL